MLFGLISAIKHGKQRPIGDSEISDERESGNRARIFIFLGVLEVSLNLKSPPCFAVFLTYANAALVALTSRYLEGGTTEICFVVG